MDSAQELGLVFHSDGTAVTIEGPRFSTKPESKFYQSLGASVVGMTLCPEVFLAKEAAISYASVAMVTDYDTWKEDAEVFNDFFLCVPIYLRGCITVNSLTVITHIFSYLTSKESSSHSCPETW